MSVTQNYKTITLSTGAFVEIEMAIRLEIAAQERQVERTHIDTIGHTAAVRRLTELRAALVEFSA